MSRFCTGRSRLGRRSTEFSRGPWSGEPPTSSASTPTLRLATSTPGSGRGSTSDLPRPAHEQGELIPGAGHAADGDVVRADHEVDVDLALVDPRQVCRIPDRARVGVAERDVACSVLVEQRVEEGAADSADPALAVDECHLPEPGRALVGGTAPAQGLGVRV